MNDTATISSAATAACVEVEKWQCDELQGLWKTLLEGSRNLNRLYQSPEWFAYLQTQAAERRPRLLAWKGGDGLPGVVPVSVEQQTWDFSVKRHVLWRTRLNCVEVLGSQPLLPDDPAAYDAVFSAIDRMFPATDCIWMSQLPTDGYCWQYLKNSEQIRRRFMRYVPGIHLTRTVELPETFDAYLKDNFTGKVRQELRRQIRVMQKQEGTPLKFRRYERPDEVDAFLEAATPVVKKSWQFQVASGRVENSPHWREKLEFLAKRGCFRSYTLSLGDAPCVYMLGYQHQDVYVASEIGFDPDFGKFSPGTVGMLLRIEDLIQHRRPRILTWGFGDSAYKKMLSNSHSELGEVFLLRRTLKNRVRKAIHSAFRGAVAMGKSLMTRWRELKRRKRARAVLV